MIEHDKKGVLSLLGNLEELIGLGIYIGPMEEHAYEEALSIAIAAVEQKYGLSLEAE